MLCTGGRWCVLGLEDKVGVSWRLGTVIGLSEALTVGLLTLGRPTAAASEQAAGLAAGEFLFTAAADYGGTSATTATLDGIAALNPAFHLALGDFSYGEMPSASAWCDYVRAHIPIQIPIEIVAGNHEDFTTGPQAGDGTIGEFAACLPDKLGNVVGDYGREYYFDFPRIQPLARFILVSPGLTLEDGARRFTRGGPHYTWAAEAIDDARNRQIPWVVVGAHKPCMTTGVQNCSAGRDFLNLLVAKKVDLVLQGHDHTYQRTKPIAAGRATCDVIRPEAFNHDCVANDSLETYMKGQGSVFVIVGTAGEAETPIEWDDPSAPYFASAMGANGQAAHGFVSIVISRSQLRATFQTSAGPPFSDAFAISAPARPVRMDSLAPR
jgi:hypothetical protein